MRLPQFLSSMKAIHILILVLLIGLKGYSQYYFPPATGNQWDTVSPASLGWCAGELDTLSKYVEARHSKSLIILHKGKIAYERYYHGHGQDSAWYWASAGKSLVAFLAGMAQQQNYLHINDKTSQYLGVGWTVAPQAKEDLITIKQQLQMTTGLDFNVPDQNCLADTCLKYLHDAGTHWYYYNAPYRLVQDVLEVATSTNLNVYTYQSLTSATGISGIWFNYVFFSKARSMARFGLLNLNNGIWDGQAILGDTAYLRAMTSPSQNLNPAYGYLWWLNGSPFFKLPGFDTTFAGQIIPTAPPDLYMAAGANDQRIYIVPSLDLVVVRQGNEAYGSQPALSQFDSELWQLLMNVICTNVNLTEVFEDELQFYPNPAKDYFQFSEDKEGCLRIFNTRGQEELNIEVKKGDKVNIASLPRGIYWLMLEGSGGRLIKN